MLTSQELTDVVRLLKYLNSGNLGEISVGDLVVIDCAGDSAGIVAHDEDLGEFVLKELS